jgi:hypothetical protein
VACHTAKGDDAAGGLVLDDNDDTSFKAVLATSDTVPSFSGLPGPYYRLAGAITNQIKASRYVVKFQSRKSLLAWKVSGRRTDGLSNDDFPSEATPGDVTTLRFKGQRIAKLNYDDKAALARYLRDFGDIDFQGSMMPPAEAVAGTYKTKDGRTIKVAALSDEDKRTIFRWIDLGCPIDLDPRYDPKAATPASYGWMGDDQRPTVTVTLPADEPGRVTRVLVGMADAYSGLEMSSFSVTADFAIDGVAAGENLAGRLKEKSPGVWEMVLGTPVKAIEEGTVTVSVKDRQGNVSNVERRFSVK